MCGWLSLPASAASATKALCFMRSSWGSRSNRNTLIATSRPPNGSRARYTELVAPLPISRRSGYFPSCSCSSNFTSAYRGAQERRDLLQQLGFLVGLAEELVDAERGGLAAMLLGRARRDHDDRDVLGARIAAHVAREVEAVHARHLDVDQHDGGERLAHLLERLEAVLRRDHLVALALEQAGRDLAHRKRVVDHHDDRRDGVGLLAAPREMRHKRGVLEVGHA